MWLLLVLILPEVSTFSWYYFTGGLPNYDSSTGNLSSKAGVSYTYNASVSCTAGNRTIPHAVSGAGGNSYAYDCNGNQVTRTIGGSAYNLAYDAENRMTSVSGATTASFVYDGDGKRVKGTSGGITTTYIGNYFEWTGSTSSMVRYYYDGATRVAVRTGSSTFNWLFGDHLGSSSRAANSDGSPLTNGEQRYKPWGEKRFPTGDSAIPTTFKFTGQRQEKLLGGVEGLYFYGARWLDPALGRFIQPDSIVQDPYNPQDFDRFAYVHNNPIINTDPSGHMLPPCRNSTDPLFTLDLSQMNHGILGALAVTLIEFVAEVPCTLIVGCRVDLVNAQIIGPTRADTANNLLVVEGVTIDPFMPELGPIFRSFTADNFRYNLMILTGKTAGDVANLQAHHVLPQEFFDFFNKIGLNINDPVFGAWVDSTHQQWSNAYNQAWKNFIRPFMENDTLPTIKEVLDFAAAIAKKYNITWDPPNLSK
jgi:RHS repeat-associated protein